MEDLKKEMPLKHLISFDKLLRIYDEMAESEDEFIATKAKRILEQVKPYPELREGFDELSVLEKHEDVINIILDEAFSTILTENEIKVASIPYYDFIFHSSERFKNILKHAGPDFNPVIENLGGGMDYIMGCILILKFYYGYKIDFSRPYYYKIPDEQGVNHFYRILYNGEFMEILQNDKNINITPEDVDELLSSPKDVELWKAKIPPGSFISKGFVISNMFDVTNEYAISAIKSELIAIDKRGNDNFISSLQETFQSFFRLKDLKVGFMTYDHRSHQFERVYGKNMKSFLLNEKKLEKCNKTLCEGSYERLVKQNSYFAVSDVDKFYELNGGKPPYEELHAQGIKSAIFAPIASEGKLLGVLEIVSKEKNALNGVNAHKLDDVMPYIVSAVVRSKVEEENLIDAVIQNECTTVHSSVYWRFKEEAKKFIKEELEGGQPTFQEIVFNEVYPLYGQIDIKKSSNARNDAIQKDLIFQLNQVMRIMEEAWKHFELPVYEELVFRIKNHLEEIEEGIQTNSEQSIFDFVNEEINPVFQFLEKSNTPVSKLVSEYLKLIDVDTGTYYDHRKKYDDSVMRTNMVLASLLDKRQIEAQEQFPHYFERYKTDGVEHNMYIGASIPENMEYNPIYLHNLRLWQLQVMCEMENRYYRLRPKLSMSLEVSSLILVYNTPLSIRFRMDEKKFDVDGTYNARYEIIKKRIDKSFIKGTNERLTQSGKLSIVYSHKKDELEYLRYVKFLKSKGYFTDNIEIVELQGLQGVSGLKAIRAEILYSNKKESERTFTYDDLIAELEN